MPETKYTTRVYQYGAVPLGPFPEEGIAHMMNANHLWNTLVALHNDNWQAYHEALCDADQEFKHITEQFHETNEKFEKLKEEKRYARMKAQTRSSDHPLRDASPLRSSTELPPASPLKHASGRTAIRSRLAIQ